MNISLKTIFSAVVIWLLSGCNEPGFPEHLDARRINQPDLQAVLISPKTHNGPMPTVIVLGGSEGGISGSQRTAQALAENGVAALAVGYFGMSGLPTSLENIPLEYFNAAVKYIDDSPRLNRNQCQQVPVIGHSRGAELALVLGSHFDHYGPVIAISPSSHVWGAVGNVEQSAWTLNGQPLSFMPRHSNPDYTVDKFVGRDYFIRDLKHDDAQQAEIDVSTINAQVLLFAGENDLLWPSDMMTQHLLTLAEQAKQSSRISASIYPKAGHVIAPGAPSSMTEAKLNGNQTLILGGNTKANKAAQDDILKRTVEAIKSPVCYDSQASFNPDKLQAP